jgi:glutaredoxin-related protein
MTRGLEVYPYNAYYFLVLYLSGAFDDKCHELLLWIANMCCSSSSATKEVLSLTYVNHKAVDVVRSEENLIELYTIEKSVIGSRRESERVRIRRCKDSGKTYNTIATSRES